MQRAALYLQLPLRRFCSVQHAPVRAKRSTPAAAAPSERPAVLSEKAKSEIRSLHLSEPKRWTAAALAARYVAPVENVSAIVRLAALRKGPPSEDATKVEAAWIALAARTPAARSRTRSVARPAPAVETAAESAVDPDTSDAGAVEDAPEEPADRVGSTPTAQWARDCIARGDVEVQRKTTYAFVEVGKGLTDDARAVWLRDGPSGKLRAPSESERRVLLGQRRA